MSNYATLVDVLIKNEMEGIKNHERVLEMGDTPAILLNECGFPELTFAIKASTVSKICFDHGIGTSVIQRLPNIVSSPKGLFRSANPRFTDSVVVLTFEVKSIGPVIVSIRQNVMIGRGKYYNIVTSMYAKEGEDPETKWKSDNLLIWDSQDT